MGNDLGAIARSVNFEQLPAEFEDLFEENYDIENRRFRMQETFVVDFKEVVPGKFSDSYGSGIVRLAISLYNTYGGVIVFGVNDALFEIIGVEKGRFFDIESFNRVLSDVTSARFECRFREYLVPGSDAVVQVVLVPRRPAASPPICLTRQIGSYESGTLWIRDRHEVLVAQTHHLPILYSRRDDYFVEFRNGEIPVHRSLPSSPSTIKEFVGRCELMSKLWDWFIFGRQPRLYLHGPGGSGKSTMAYEFAKTIVDAAPNISVGNGQGIDYVIYLSGKETEFNVLSGKQQTYALRDFQNVDTQFRQILYHAGMLDRKDLLNIDSSSVEELLRDLFDNMTGLIVIDDIDALSRRNLDTGEEALFLKAAQAAKRTRILYTLRYIPPYALRSALGVPGLDFEIELPDFIESCCKQFGCPEPAAEDLPVLHEKTDGLPLLVETIIGLRHDCSSYQAAFRVFDQKGGDEARKYLYQREYDRLDRNGKSRAVLAALMLLETPTTFTLLCGLVPFSQDQVKDAIAETSGIFLSSSENDAGETTYEIAPPAIHLIRAVSPSLTFFPAVKRAVELFRDQASKMTPEEAVVVGRFEHLIRQKKYAEIIQAAGLMRLEDPVQVNPRFQALLGQAYSQYDPPNFSQARECFKIAIGKSYWDIYMMRRWYYIESHSGYSLSEAQKICEIVIHSPDITSRHKSEFNSKLGECFLAQAKPHLHTDRRRAIDFTRRSLAAYFEAAWLSGVENDMDRNKTYDWLESATKYFFRILGDEPEPLFSFLESLAEVKHDVDIEAARIVIEPLRALRTVRQLPLRNKIKGLCSRTIAALSRANRKERHKGFEYIINRLTLLRTEIETAAPG